MRKCSIRTINHTRMQSKRFQRDRGQLGVVVRVFNSSAQNQRPVGLSEVPNLVKDPKNCTWTAEWGPSRLPDCQLSLPDPYAPWLVESVGFLMLPFFWVIFLRDLLESRCSWEGVVRTCWFHCESEGTSLVFLMGACSIKRWCQNKYCMLLIWECWLLSFRYACFNSNNHRGYVPSNWSVGRQEVFQGVIQRYVGL